LANIGRWQISRAMVAQFRVFCTHFFIKFHASIIREDVWRLPRPWGVAFLGPHMKILFVGGPQWRLSRLGTGKTEHGN
jgi:hypothetical protein